MIADPAPMRIIDDISEIEDENASRPTLQTPCEGCAKRDKFNPR